MKHFSANIFNNCFFLFLLELSDAKAIVAALELILTSSARYGVSPADLSSELQQLGLPREHSAAVARLHTDNCPQITAILTSQSLRRELLYYFYTLD